MRNILHIMDASDGGISMVVLNFMRNIDRNEYHFDIATTNQKLGNNALELENLGANIFSLPMKSNGLKAYCNSLNAILELKHYDSVHVHENQTSFIALMIAKRAGVPIRIAHSHTSAPCNSIKDSIKRIVGCLLNGWFSTDLIACGSLAGERVFGKHNMKKNKAHIIPNSIVEKNFVFNRAARFTERNRYNVADRFVVGMVGRLSKEKNHIFALDVIKEFSKVDPNSILMIVGEGELETNIISYIKSQNLENHVILTGSRKDVNYLYSAMDCFIMTSIHEGFPVVALEAMTSGLPMIISDRITNELKFYPCLQYCSLGKLDEWVYALKQINENDKNRIALGTFPSKNGYSMKDTINQLEEIYSKN